MTNFEKILTSILGFVIGVVIVLAGYNVNLKNKIANQVPLIIQDKVPYVDLGEHLITYYCNPNNNKTASGTKTVENRTIAVDINGVLKFGDVVYIEGFDKPFIAEDTGRLIKNKRIDIYVDDCQRAMANGVDKLKVYKIGG